MACLIMTLAEMLKLALGTTTPDCINVTILHSLLEIIIRKLEIQSDFVEISGPEVCDLRQMLQRARSPILQFKSCSEEEVSSKRFTTSTVDNMEERMTRLTETVDKLEHGLKAHLEDMERTKRPSAPSRLKLKRPFVQPEKEGEDSFSSDCEDLCSPCEQQNIIACDLLQNPMFLKKLMRRITSPIVDRIFDFETMIGLLNEKFQNFLNTAEDEYRKIPLVEECLCRLEKLQMELVQQKEEFIATMEEIQEMLESKVDKVHIPPLKKYISDRMDEIEAQLRAIEFEDQYPKAAGVILNNMQCLCCTTRVCQKDSVFPVPLLPTVVHSESATKTGGFPRLCIPRDRDRACGGKHTLMSSDEKTLKKTNLIVEFGDEMNLHISTNNVEYFKGVDGGMYRLATQNSG